MSEKLKGDCLYIAGVNIPVIADSIEADPPVDVSTTQQVSTASGVGTKGYQTLKDSQCEVSFSCPLVYKGQDIIALIDSLYDPINGSTIVVASDETQWQYNECFRTARDKTSFNGEKAFKMTFTGSPG